MGTSGCMEMQAVSVCVSVPPIQKQKHGDMIG